MAESKDWAEFPLVWLRLVESYRADSAVQVEVGVAWRPVGAQPELYS